MNAGISNGIKINRMPESGLIKMLANTMADTAPDAPTAVYHALFLCFPNEGVADNNNPPTYSNTKKYIPLPAPNICMKTSSTILPNDKRTNMLMPR